MFMKPSLSPLLYGTVMEVSAIVIVSVGSVDISILFLFVFLLHYPLYGPSRILACCQCSLHIF